MNDLIRIVLLKMHAKIKPLRKQYKKFLFSDIVYIIALSGKFKIS